MDSGRDYVSADAIAAKASCISDPSQKELIVFIGWRAQQPGGWRGLGEELIEHAGVGALLPTEFKVLRSDSSGRFSAGDALTVWWKFPKWARAVRPDKLADLVDRLESFNVQDEKAVHESGLGSELESFRGWLTQDLCVATCRKKAVERFAHYCSLLFAEIDSPLPRSLNYRRGWESSCEKAKWNIFDGLPEALTSFLGAHAKRELATIAQTAVTKMIFEAVDYCWDQKAVVHITGNARYGKTESLQAQFRARPGRYRIIHTTAGNSEKELLLAMSQALGLGLDTSTPTSKLKQKISFFLQSTGTACFFDESQFLVPDRITKLTAPARLNFVRREIIDRGLPCVFASTPQAHNKAIEDFTGKTKYAMEQWLGRVDMQFVLPEITKQDVMGVARVHFPNMPEKVLLKIVARAGQSDSFLHAAHAIAKRARWLAGKAGHTSPTVDDVDQAAEDFEGGVRIQPDKKEPRAVPVAGIEPAEQLQTNGSRFDPSRISLVAPQTQTATDK